MRKPRTGRSTFAAAFAVATLFTVNASAYRVLERNGVAVGWPTDTRLTLELVDDAAALLPIESVRSEILQAMQLWNGQTKCSAPALALGSSSIGLAQSGDSRNTIAWVHSNWLGIPGAQPESPGVTDLRIGPDANGTYRIVEADIYLNAELFGWSLNTGGAGRGATQKSQYLKEVVAHELGHVLGLDHSCEFEPAAGVPDCAQGWFTTSLMYPMAQDVEPAVDTDDANGLCSLYQVPACTQAAGGCAATTSTPATVDIGPVPVAPGGPCTATAECRMGLVCVLGHCAEGNGAPGDPCETYADCSDGTCVNGACRAMCSKQEPCEHGEVCDSETSSCGVTLKTLGAACTAAAECTSAQCVVQSNAKSYCTKECSYDVECPSGWRCSLMNQFEVCMQPLPTAEGCSLSRISRRAGQPPAIALLLGISLIGLRIRRHQRMGEN